MYDLYLIISLVLTLFYTAAIKDNRYEILYYRQYNSSSVLLFVLAVLYAVWIGMRPIDGGFGDTFVYAMAYNDLSADYKGSNGEYGFNYIMNLCKPFFDATGFFIVVALGYFVCTAYSMKRLLNGNGIGGFLIFLGTFSTFTYAANGIRNGLACSILSMAIVFVAINKKLISIIPIILSLAALSIHKSTILPIIALIWSVYIKNPKVAFYFWLFSIPIFLTVGSSVGGMLASLGFDDRMSNYLKETISYGANYKTGFRPDFLLYSAMPIFLGYNVIFRKKIRDRTYEILLNTYIFSNAVWVMIMNISFSNRFAYLSWFLYPIVLAYPCLKMNIWGALQGKYAARIIMANIMFTIFMHFIYYS